jgi:site-specific DNA recombinase
MLKGMPAGTDPLPLHGGQDGPLALCYVRARADLNPPLDAEVQHAALRELCRGEGLVAGDSFEDAPDQPGPAFRSLIDAARTLEGRQVVAAAAALPVFADRVRDQAVRVLQLETLQIPLVLADGQTPAMAVRHAWEERPYTEQRRDRAREGMRRRALRGEVLGRPAYGYVVRDRTLHPEPSEAAVVRRIFSMYLDEHEGVRRIAKRLNDEGLRTRRGGAWTSGMVRNLLRNPVYTGLYRRLGVSVPRAHEAIIDRGRFEEVQRRMERRRTAPSVQVRHDYLLSGLLICGACGNRMIGARRPSEAAGGGELVYYRCESATNQGRCSFRTRHADELETAVREELRHATGYPVAVRPPPPAFERGAARMQSLQRELSRMLERYAAGEWTWNELRRRSAPNVIEQLEIEEAHAAATISTIDPEAARQRILADWDELPFVDRRRLMRECIAEVVVTDDGVLVTRRR